MYNLVCIFIRSTTDPYPPLASLPISLLSLFENHALFTIEEYKYLFEESNLDLFLNSNLIDFDQAGDGISSATFKSYNNYQIKLNAKLFVLATGGIENSRLMLAINQKNNLTLFNKEMPIGKYWMEHPHFTIGESIIPSGGG